MLRSIALSVSSVVALAAGTAGSLEAQAPLPKLPTEVALIITVYECDQPMGVACMCYAESQKAKCPQCTHWVKKTKPASIPTAGIKDSYNAMSDFVADLSADSYKASTPTRSTREIFANPSAAGFMQVPDSARKAGTIAVWNGGAALVVTDSLGNLQVVYPSAKNGGALNRTDLKYLTADQVKFVVPKDFVASVTGVRPPGGM